MERFRMHLEQQDGCIGCDTEGRLIDKRMGREGETSIVDKSPSLTVCCVESFNFLAMKYSAVLSELVQLLDCFNHAVVFRLS